MRLTAKLCHGTYYRKCVLCEGYYSCNEAERSEAWVCVNCWFWGGFE